MTLNLMTVSGFVKGIRGLLQDRRKPYRYSDEAVLAGLNLAMLEGSRVRPDIFICRYGTNVPQFESVNGDNLGIEAKFRLAFEYGAAAHVLLRDQEDVQDQRANTLNENFHNILVGVRPAPVQGGTPTPQEAGATNAKQSQQ